jgi:hypothetical protein
MGQPNMKHGNLLRDHDIIFAGTRQYLVYNGFFGLETDMGRQHVYLVNTSWHQGQMKLTLVVEFQESTLLMLKDEVDEPFDMIVTQSHPLPNIFLRTIVMLPCRFISVQKMYGREYIPSVAGKG